MEPKVIIYGTEECPYVKKAREDYGDRAIFYNVKTDPERLPKPKVTLTKGSPSASASATEAREGFPDKGIYMPCAYTREHLREVWK